MKDLLLSTIAKVTSNTAILALTKSKSQHPHVPQKPQKATKKFSFIIQEDTPNITISPSAKAKSSSPHWKT